MFKNRKLENSKIKEGNLIKVEMTPDIRIRMECKQFGHLADVFFENSTIVGIVTKLWNSGNIIRELELLSEGEFFIVTTNNGVKINEIEVLSC